MTLHRFMLPVLMASILVACATAPGIPETTYHRLPEPVGIERMAEAVVDLPIVVDAFVADGLYADQALIYALDEDAARLRTYHFQLWIDPPARLMQRRMIKVLRTARAARVVTDQLPTSMQTLRVRGRIVRLERLRTAAGWEVVAGLVLRVEPSAGGRPWVIGDYRQRVVADGERVADSVRALGTALDRIAEDFLMDLSTQAKARGESEKLLQIHQVGAH